MYILYLDNKSYDYAVAGIKIYILYNGKCKKDGYMKEYSMLNGQSMLHA